MRLRRGEVHARLGLVNGPGVLDATGARARQGELGLFDAVGHLKDHAEQEAHDDPAEDVAAENDGQPMELQRNPEGQREEDNLAGHEDHELPASGARHAVEIDAAPDDLAEVVQALPLDRQKPIERPQVQVLPSMKREPLLVRRQPREGGEVDVGIMASDVDVRVMEHAVLPAPQVGASADQLQGQCHEPVDPGAVRVGSMPAVVLDVGADPCRKQAEQDGQGHALDPGPGQEYQRHVRTREPHEKDRRLHVHLPAVALPPTGGPEMLRDAPPKRELERRYRD